MMMTMRIMVMMGWLWRYDYRIKIWGVLSGTLCVTDTLVASRIWLLSNSCHGDYSRKSPENWFYLHVHTWHGVKAWDCVRVCEWYYPLCVCVCVCVCYAYVHVFICACYYHMISSFLFRIEPHGCSAFLTLTSTNKLCEVRGRREEGAPSYYKLPIG